MLDGNKILDLLSEGKVTPIEIERIINSLTRNETKTPTGVIRAQEDQNQQDSRLN